MYTEFRGLATVPLAASCELVNEPTGFIEDGKSLNKLLGKNHELITL
jgi:hypothetical protein